MKKYTFEDIEKSGLLLYRYVRGSQAYGTATPQSDTDEGAVYLEPIEQVLGLGLDFQEEISDEKHDITWYGLKKYMNLLCSSNPNILESLFVPDRCVLYETPIITEIKAHKEQFLTKECFNSFIGYAIAQIKRAKGYNKLCVNPIEKRLWPLDFCYTTYKQGTANMREWLQHRGLEQRFCGLVSLNNMPMCYSVFYDFGAHNAEKYHGNFDEFAADELYYNYIQSSCNLPARSVMAEWFNEHQKPVGYRGIVREDGESDDVRCSSIEKYILPICTMCYNKNGFESHCRKYKEYQEWTRKRNPVRYSDNEGYNFDSKNMSHSFRLLHMGLEIAREGKFIVDRTGIDADYLLDIRNHKYTYEELIERLEAKKNELDEAIEKCTLPDTISREYVNEMMVDIRKKYQLQNYL